MVNLGLILPPYRRVKSGSFSRKILVHHFLAVNAASLSGL
jgi:hypothetical protein